MTPPASIESQNKIHLTKLLKEEVVGDEYLALCWEQDNAKEVADTDMWIKSNPLMELSEQKERLTENKKRLLGEGKAKGSISNVLTKEFNIWVQSSQESYMSEEEWTSAVAPDYIKQTDLTGREIYIGVDLSRVNDLTSISWVIPIREESKFLTIQFNVQVDVWVPTMKEVDAFYFALDEVMRGNGWQCAYTEQTDDEDLEGAKRIIKRYVANISLN